MRQRQVLRARCIPGAKPPGIVDLLAIAELGLKGLVVGGVGVDERVVPAPFFTTSANSVTKTPFAPSRTFPTASGLTGWARVVPLKS